jgi:hypothetical protein
MNDDTHDAGGSGERPSHDDELAWLDLYPVYDAADEDSAIHVQALLVSAGIEARIRSAQVPGFDGAFASAVGFWGQVMVPRREVVQARALLEQFEARRTGEAAPPPEDTAQE